MRDYWSYAQRLRGELARQRHAHKITERIDVLPLPLLPISKT